MTAVQQDIQGTRQFVLHRGSFAELMQVIDDQQRGATILGSEVRQGVCLQGVAVIAAQVGSRSDDRFGTLVELSPAGGESASKSGFSRGTGTKEDEWIVSRRVLE